MTDPIPPTPPGARRRQSIWQTIKSVSAAFFGVQSAKNRARDETQGKASHFIAIGLVMTVVFVLVLWLAVKLALRAAGQ